MYSAKFSKRKAIYYFFVPEVLRTTQKHYCYEIQAN